jgi:hypothetical protein
MLSRTCRTFGHMARQGLTDTQSPVVPTDGRPLIPLKVGIPGMPYCAPVHAIRESDWRIENGCIRFLFTSCGLKTCLGQTHVLP